MVLPSSPIFWRIHEVFLFVGVDASDQKLLQRGAFYNAFTSHWDVSAPEHLIDVACDRERLQNMRWAMDELDDLVGSGKLPLGNTGSPILAVSLHLTVLLETLRSETS